MSNALLDLNSQTEAAGRLREEKTKADLPVEENGQDEDSNVGSASLRERVMQAKNTLDLKDKVRQKIEEKTTAPAKMATSQFLQKMWLLAPETFGLTGLYANVHVFLRWVFGEKLFCKLGEEWVPKQVAAAGGGAAEKAGEKMGMIEIVVLGVLDLIVLFLILMFITWIFILVYAYSSPLQAIWEFGKASLKIILDALSAIM